MLRPLLISAALASALSACTWVKMEPGGTAVRVARAGDDLSVCNKRGEVGVSVRDRVGLYQRNDLKVRDELETMARNEATGLGADTVQALNEPSGGEQRFGAWTCGRHAATARATAPQAPQAQPLVVEDAQTYPVKED